MRAGRRGRPARWQTGAMRAAPLFSAFPKHARVSGARRASGQGFQHESACCGKSQRRTNMLNCPRGRSATNELSERVALQRWGCGAGREATGRGGATRDNPWAGEGVGASGASPTQPLPSRINPSALRWLRSSITRAGRTTEHSTTRGSTAHHSALQHTEPSPSPAQRCPQRHNIDRPLMCYLGGV